MKIRNCILFLLKCIFFIISVPIILIIYVIDSRIAHRISTGRYGIRDFFPHFLVISFSFGVYSLLNNNYISINSDKLTNALPSLINFEGIIFAISLTVTTFVLSFFRPHKLKLNSEDKIKDVEDIIDDLRITNRLLFIILIFIFSIWFYIDMMSYNVTNLLLTLIIGTLIWSILLVDSIVRGVFYIIKVEDN